jgi:hypothetical protein
MTLGAAYRILEGLFTGHYLDCLAVSLLVGAYAEVQSCPLRLGAVAVSARHC